MQAALETSGYNELGQPTLAPGETYEELLADRTAFEEFDPTRRPSAGTGSCGSASSPSSTCSAPADVPLVAGVDTSTQSCKVVVRDADSGALVREGRAAHPEGTEVHPDAWWSALGQAVAAAGGLDDVAAVAIAGQQHGMVTLDDAGEVVRPALPERHPVRAPARRLVEEHGGPGAWAQAVGSVPVASLRWPSWPGWRSTSPPRRRVPAVCLPHDWLTWRLLGAPGPEALVTDRGDASGTGYWSAATGEYRRDLLTAALGHDAQLPRVLAPDGRAARRPCRV